jgi:hypothetical protein
MRYLTLSEVVELHRRILRPSGGSSGIRDLGALESALASPDLAALDLETLRPLIEQRVREMREAFEGSPEDCRAAFRALLSGRKMRASQRTRRGGCLWCGTGCEADESGFGRLPLSWIQAARVQVGRHARGSNMRPAGARVAGEGAEARVDARVRPWFLVLTDASPVSPAWTGAAVTLVLVGCLAALRLGVGQEIATAPRGFPDEVGLQIRLFFCVLSGYLIAAMAYQERGVLRDLEDLRPGLRVPGAPAEMRRDLTHFPLRRLVQAILLGMVAHIVIVFGARGVLPSSIGAQIFPLFLWLVAAPATYIALSQAAVFRRVGRQASVQLFDLRRHGVYVRAGLRIALVAAGPMALAAVAHTDWSSVELPLYFLILSGLVWAPLCVAMTLLPVWGIHRAIQAEKQREQDRILAAIAGDSAALEASPLAAHASALTGVTLLDYLEKVDRVREWPFDASALRRLGLYLLIPPLGWLGGALVERTLERMLP